MKTLTELARELRMRAQIETQMSTLIRATALEKAAIEAADRLDAIDKAWRTSTDTYEALKAAIEGTD